MESQAKISSRFSLLWGFYLAFFLLFPAGPQVADDFHGVNGLAECWEEAGLGPSSPGKLCSEGLPVP